MEHLSDAEVEELKLLCTQRKQELEKLLDLREEAAKPVELDQQSVGRVSRIDAIQQQKMMEASKEQAKRELLTLERALLAIAEQDYGFCEECGENIPFARLAVKPAAELCIQCQSSLEENE